MSKVSVRFRRYRNVCTFLFAVFLFGGISQFAAAQEIEWHVVNRFRLFKDKKDFELHEKAALENDSILSSERWLSEKHGQGWAAPLFVREIKKFKICLNQYGTHIDMTCLRDGDGGKQKENYLNPKYFSINLFLKNGDVSKEKCIWRFKEMSGKNEKKILSSCKSASFQVNRDTQYSVSVSYEDNPEFVVSSSAIAVKHILIAGIGDSIASGEGNPDVPVVLQSGTSMCMGDTIRPLRAGGFQRRACPSPGGGEGSDERTTKEEWKLWGNSSARWVSPACHRSLYGYQMRTALALAIKNKDAAITYVPLGCTGATIKDGLLHEMTAREYYGGQTKVLSQISMLSFYKSKAGRPFDALLLTIGANDIGFSGLIADAIFPDGWDRSLLDAADLFSDEKTIVTVDEAERRVNEELKPQFEKLRKKLKELVAGEDLKNVVFAAYPNPLKSDGKLCPGGPYGFDIFPSFSVDKETIHSIDYFVENSFFPNLKNLATCGSGSGCRVPDKEQMTFVDEHQDRFRQHGYCARGNNDPSFDNQCFRTDGTSFENENRNIDSSSLVHCDGLEHKFSPYAKRKRWFRTANDGYFTAMTYPDDKKFRSIDIHDKLWGAYGSLYSGAIHPTAEGHAAIADKVLIKLAERLNMKGW